MSRIAARPVIGRVSHSNEFATPLEFFSAVAAASVPRGQEDPRLAPLRFKAAAGSDEAQTQRLEAGGYLMPTYLLPGFQSTTVEKDPTASRVMRVKMPGLSCKIPARVDFDHRTSVSGGVKVSRKEETGLAQTSQLSMRQIGLESNAMFGAAFATEELMISSRDAFATVLSRAFQDETSSQLFVERLTGTGAGQFAGVLNSPCLITVQPDVSQPTATISASNAVKMRSQCFGYDEAIWLANHDAYEQIATLALVGGGGGVTMLFVPSHDEDEPDFFCSRPIFFTEYCETVGSFGDLLLGNWSQYIEGTLQPFSGVDSMHVRFINHERCFKFWTHNAGAPWWMTTLTPKNSAKELSPFVALAARP